MTNPRAEELDRTIRRATVASIAIGIVLSPIPLADELVFLPASGAFAAKIARMHDLQLTEVPWGPIARTALSGLAARAAINVTVSYIPFVAAAANAASAAALTQFFGRYVALACENTAAGKETLPLGWRDIVATLRPGKAAAAT
jgi:uncharacterized protein (DUF697 family)